MAQSGAFPLRVKLTSPRGFCAGVERAIRIVEDTLAAHGAPVFVRHEIVHNRHVVERLKAMGAVFIEDLNEADSNRPVIISAHGAPAAVHAEAARRKLPMIDATCPLVLKVHSQIRRYAAQNAHTYLIGHAGHPEVIGAMGQAPDGSMTLVEDPSDVSTLPDRQGPKAYATQTTLSVDDAAETIKALKMRFPDIIGPSKEDICYATSNRQEAVKAAAAGTDLFVILGSETSSNSKRLVETALRAGAAQAVLINDVSELNAAVLSDVGTIGLSAGASAPEILIESFLKTLAQQRSIIVETVETAVENIVFKSPQPLKLAS
ncbi:MAG: 4-hydroxy-3-methylbut-2-enyl diphosphate reductase [Pseudomonadota bacterium]